MTLPHRLPVLPFLLAVPFLCGDKISARGGDIEIIPITHATVRIDCGGKTMYADPWSGGDYTGAKPADLIVITGAERDHVDLEAIAKIRNPPRKLQVQLPHDRMIMQAAPTSRKSFPYPFRTG